jgi:hypothetical protein
MERKRDADSTGTEKSRRTEENRWEREGKKEAEVPTWP